LAADGKKVYKYCGEIWYDCKIKRFIEKSAEFSIEKLCLDKWNEQSEKLGSLIGEINL